AIECDIDCLLIGHIGERYRHHVSADRYRAARIASATGANAPRPRGYLRLWASGHRDIVGEGSDYCKVVSGATTTAFHPGCASERHIDIHVACPAMWFARHCARHGCWARLVYGDTVHSPASVRDGVVRTHPK